MNHEQINEMMDAIFSDQDYALLPKMEEGWQGMTVGISDDSVLFTTENDFLGTRLNDPKVARSIAGALVLWANQREEIELTGIEAEAGFRLFGWFKPKPKDHNVNSNRQTWYHRNVGLMMPRTMYRHWRDLRTLARVYANESRDSDLADVNRSIGVLWKAMRDTDEFDMDPKVPSVNWRVKK